MRTSVTLFLVSACTLLEGARSGCTGKVLPFANHRSGHAGCYEVYVSCWTKLGDSCDFRFDLPLWSAGYERVTDFAGTKDTYFKTYPSEDDVLTMARPSNVGRLHCGSDDGSPQWKNYEDVVVCRAPTPSPTSEPTMGPTLDPTPAPTASVPLDSDAVRRALDGLCASRTTAACADDGDPASLRSAEEECRAEAHGIVASLVEEATTDTDDDAIGGEEGSGVDVAAASLIGTGDAVGRLAPFLLAVAVAVAAVSVVTSRFGHGPNRYNNNHHREYEPVPDAAGP